MDKKIKIARLSIFSNLFLIGLKLFTGLVTGSVSILSEAIHSGIDLIASAIAFFAVKISAKAPDKRHPYGHGKFENISGVIEGLLIFVAAFWIIYEAIHKIAHPSEVKLFQLAAGVMLISALVNFFVSRKLYKVAEETDSIALKADALHLKTDIYSSIGVGLGMLFIWITGWHILDPVFAIIVALFIMKESFDLTKDAISPLLDTQVNEKEYQKLHNDISRLTKNRNVEFNHLRSRKSGATHIIDFTLIVPPQMTVIDSHDICDTIESEIKSNYLDTDISIHVEPMQNTVQ
ncbi:MAG: cation diffusion facilitator family transporter [Bacteroidales bacterium]|nr:cation diffusion facilitator family transporter [Bacteroidales bacterium]